MLNHDIFEAYSKKLRNPTKKFALKPQNDMMKTLKNSTKQAASAAEAKRSRREESLSRSKQEREWERSH